MPVKRIAASDTLTIRDEHGEERDAGGYNPAVADADYELRDLGDARLLTVDGREYRTYYSARVVRMLLARKGARRAPLYFPFKESRGRHFLERLFTYLARRGARDLSILEVGCSFGHVTEYLNEQPLVGRITSFDVDLPFVEITRTKVRELGLAKVRDVLHLSTEETTRLPFDDERFDVVVAVGVVEHLPSRHRHRHVDEYYRVLARGGHITILDTPNRAFPLETHSVGLPGVQWLSPRWAFRYARALRGSRLHGVTFEEFEAAAWRNASLRECLPSGGHHRLADVTEEAGYGWRFFRETARSRTRRALLPAFAVAGSALAVMGRPRSLALPYFNLVFRKA
jgi:SAM-dependent methyltransferase